MSELPAAGALRRLEQEGPAPVYLLTGEETLLQERFLAALEARLWPEGEQTSLHRHRYEGEDRSIRELVDLARTPGFLNRRRLIVVTDPPALTGGEDPGPLLDYLAEPHDGSCLVLHQRGKPDRRRALYKALRRQALVVLCEAPKGRELHSWIEASFKRLDREAEPAAVARLADALPDGLQLLASEIEKLATLAGGGRTVTAADVERALAGPGTGHVFDLVDAIGERRVGDAVAQLDALLEAGAPPLRIFYMITRQVRLIAQARALKERGLGRRAVAEALGQHPYVVRKVLAQAGRFQADELARAMERLLVTDVTLKRSGQPAASVLETLVIALAAGTPAAPVGESGREATRR